ncbi:MAG: ribokinase [Kofleriaceae bacterium]
MVKRLCVVGSINLDLVLAVEALPGHGETVLARGLERFPGGKGANQALAARLLGAEVDLVGMVGRDAAAQEALQLLQRHGVGLSRVAEHAELATGTAVITVADDGANQIVVAAGANAALGPEPLDLGGADAVICQLEIPAEVVARAAEVARGFVCLNLAPVRPLPPAALRRADLVVVNEVEAAQLGDALREVRGLLAVTLGARGAVLSHRGAELARVAAPVVRAVDTTAAGDAFVAALTLALIEELPPREALGFACAAGAVTVTRPGAQPSLPTRAEVMALLHAARR